MSRTATTPQTSVEAARAAIGAVHLLRARKHGAGTWPVVFHRVLGVRQVVQALVVGRTDTGDAHTVSAAVDAAHAVTMLPMLLLGRRARRIGAGQFAIALALTVAEIALVGRGRRR